MADVAEVHVQRAEQQGHAERDCVQLQDAGDHGDHAPRVVRVREEAEEDDHAEVDG